MKIQANTIRPGNVIEHNGKVWSVAKIQIITPGKGGAFIQVEMRDMKSGSKTNERFRTQETVEKLQANEQECQYLFAEGDMLTLMDNESFEQFNVPKEMVGEALPFLIENMPVTVDTIEGQPVAVRIPETVTMRITEADPVVKGQTAASSYKPAMLENGVRIMVPPFVESGTRVVVKTSDATYVERAKD
ncbi:MAG TPA: elongation factor P [Alphaproteobacteria bacterium]|jgi:elongation factor P